MTNLESTIAEFKNYLDKANMLDHTLSIMYYDAATGAPIGGAGARAKRMALLEAEAFSIRTSQTAKGYIDALEEQKPNLDDVSAAILRVSRRAYDKSAGIPTEKIRDFAELRSKSSIVWQEARKNNNFESFAPYLKSIIDAKKDMLSYRKSDQHPYDMLLDDYEEGLTMKICDEFFEKLKTSILPLLKRIKQSVNKPAVVFRSYHVDINKQREITYMIAKAIGYDLNRGMIRESAHPFCCSAGRDDVRITTRYRENDFISSILCIMHECGHAIYEQNAGDNIANTSLEGNSASTGIHESQSRFYENIIGRSLPFWQFLIEKIRPHLTKEFSKVTSEMFFKSVNVAEPSLIRVEADELTYNLHIILRYEIEKMMFSEDIDVNKLPRIWNDKMKEYLGITPNNNTNGILQDIHWAEGLMGYFPSYILGSAYAAQLEAYVQQEMNISSLIRDGDFESVTSWLKEHVHRHGALFTPNQLLQRISGEDFNPNYYIDYLTKKFSTVYKLS